MNYIGKWRFHSIGVINESGELIYLSAEEYINSPMPYIDETDEDAVANEIDEEIRRIINECYKTSKDILNKNKKLLDLIANVLLEEETITKEQIDYLVEHGHLPKDDNEETTDDVEKEKNKNNHSCHGPSWTE